jgi:hypothetical protein
LCAASVTGFVHAGAPEFDANTRKPDMMLEQRRIYEWLIEQILSFSKNM